jgi:S1-C subfamily serine protease
MKRFIISLLIFITFLYSKEKNIKSLYVEENGVQIVIVYPKKILKGDRIKIAAFMKNKYKYARMGGLTLSFPQFKYSKLSYVDNTFDNISSYSPPDKIFSSVLKRNISAKYYMVEGWEYKWYKNDVKAFYVEINVPKDFDNIVVNVRGVLVFGPKKNRYEIKVPSKSYQKDQQGYPVKRILIPIGNELQVKYPKKTITPEIKNKKPKTSTGTGFFINSNILLTNNHVIEGCKNLKVVRTGFKTTANVISVDKNNDLAILKTKDESKNILKFQNEKKVRIGESVIAMGYPLGDLLGSNIKLTTGNISALNGLLNDFTKMQFTAPVQPGNSGGPLLNNKGSVIGIIYAKLKNNIAQNVNLAIKQNVAKMFLDANDIKYEINQNYEKKEVVDIAQDVKEGIVQIICTQ